MIKSGIILGPYFLYKNLYEHVVKLVDNESQNYPFNKYQSQCRL